jgi:hypothetical protein
MDSNLARYVPPVAPTNTAFREHGIGSLGERQKKAATGLRLGDGFRLVGVTTRKKGHREVDGLRLMPRYLSCLEHF